MATSEAVIVLRAKLDQLKTDLNTATNEITKVTSKLQNINVKVNFDDKALQDAKNKVRELAQNITTVPIKAVLDTDALERDLKASNTKMQNIFNNTIFKPKIDLSEFNKTIDDAIKRMNNINVSTRTSNTTQNLAGQSISSQFVGFLPSALPQIKEQVKNTQSLGFGEEVAAIALGSMVGETGSPNIKAQENFIKNLQELVRQKNTFAYDFASPGSVKLWPNSNLPPGGGAFFGGGGGMPPGGMPPGGRPSFGGGDWNPPYFGPTGPTPGAIYENAMFAGVADKLAKRKSHIRPPSAFYDKEAPYSFDTEIPGEQPSVEDIAPPDSGMINLLNDIMAGNVKPGEHTTKLNRISGRKLNRLMDAIFSSAPEGWQKIKREGMPGLNWSFQEGLNVGNPGWWENTTPTGGGGFSAGGSGGYWIGPPRGPSGGGNMPGGGGFFGGDYNGPIRVKGTEDPWVAVHQANARANAQAFEEDTNSIKKNKAGLDELTRFLSGSNLNARGKKATPGGASGGIGGTGNAGTGGEEDNKDNVNLEGGSSKLRQLLRHSTQLLILDAVGKFLQGYNLESIKVPIGAEQAAGANLIAGLKNVPILGSAANMIEDTLFWNVPEGKKDLLLSQMSAEGTEGAVNMLGEIGRESYHTGSRFDIMGQQQAGIQSYLPLRGAQRYIQESQANTRNAQKELAYSVNAQNLALETQMNANPALIKLKQRQVIEQKAASDYSNLLVRYPSEIDRLNGIANATGQEILSYTQPYTNLIANNRARLGEQQGQLGLTGAEYENQIRKDESMRLYGVISHTDVTKQLIGGNQYGAQVEQLKRGLQEQLYITAPEKQGIVEENYNKQIELLNKNHNLEIKSINDQANAGQLRSTGAFYQAEIQLIKANLESEIELVKGDADKKAAVIAEANAKIAELNFKNEEHIKELNMQAAQTDLLIGRQNLQSKLQAIDDAAKLEADQNVKNDKALEAIEKKRQALRKRAIQEGNDEIFQTEQDLEASKEQFIGKSLDAELRMIHAAYEKRRNAAQNDKERELLNERERVAMLLAIRNFGGEGAQFDPRFSKKMFGPTFGGADMYGPSAGPNGGIVLPKNDPAFIKKFLHSATQPADDGGPRGEKSSANFNWNAGHWNKTSKYPQWIPDEPQASTSSNVKNDNGTKGSMAEATQVLEKIWRQLRIMTDNQSGSPVLNS